MDPTAESTCTSTTASTRNRNYTVAFRLLLHLRPNYIHSASNDIHTDGPRATARARG